MRRLLERSFRANVSAAAAWAHLEEVEQWPSWARHIRRVELDPPGKLTPTSRGTIHLTNGVRSTFVVEELNPGVKEIIFVVDAEGTLVSLFGPLFAAVYRGNLERAIPSLIRELKAP